MGIRTSSHQHGCDSTQWLSACKCTQLENQPSCTSLVGWLCTRYLLNAARTAQAASCPAGFSYWSETVSKPKLPYQKHCLKGSDAVRKLCCPERTIYTSSPNFSSTWLDMSLPQVVLHTGCAAMQQLCCKLRNGDHEMN